MNNLLVAQMVEMSHETFTQVGPACIYLTSIIFAGLLPKPTFDLLPKEKLQKMFFVVNYA